MPVIAVAQDAPTNDDAITDIVVTATRREVSVRDVPVAVTAIGGDQLRARQIVDISDLSSVVPNFQFGSSYGAARATVRGIGTNDLTGGADPGVAYHLNGVYIGVTGPAGNAFFDVSRVEVLRGPQGTLFGRNATGGSINMITNRPIPEAGGYVSLTAGVDPFLYNFEGAVNGQLDSNGTLSGRLSATRSYNEGYYKNLVPTGPKRLADDDSYGVRGQLLFKPSDAVELHAQVDYQKTNSNGPAYKLTGRNSIFDGPTLAEVIINFGLQTTGFVGNPINLPPQGGQIAPRFGHDVSVNYGSAKGDFLLGTIDGTIDVGPGTLKILLSAGRTESTVQIDGDLTSFDLIRYDIGYTAKQYFGEATYEVSPVAGLDIIIGANGFRSDITQFFDVPLNVLFGPSTFTIALGGQTSSRSFAQFAHAEYDVSDRIKIFGGVRHTKDKKIYSEFNNLLLLTTGVGTASGSPSWDKLTYEAGISGRLADNVQTYLKYSTGFKGGGLQLGSLIPAANPETNKSLEAGVKGIFLDGLLEANLAAFHMPYRDLQVTKVENLSARYVNAAQATVNGAEMEFVLHPSKAFRLEFNGALLDAKFKDFVNSNPADPVPVAVNLAGNRLPNTSRASFSLGGYYSAGQFTFGARYYWQGKQYLNAFNIPNLSQEAVGRVDLNVNFTSANGEWTGSIFAKNLTNEAVRTTGNNGEAFLGSPAYVTLAPGRSIGVSVRKNF
jgi:iron complex outermembrane receptor protein